jgi:adenine-specific DNA-methyltransferase
VGLPSVLPIMNGTELTIGPNLTRFEPTFFSATRNLIDHSGSLDDLRNSQTRTLDYFPDSQLITDSMLVMHYANAQLRRSEIASNLSASVFAGSASYMGSKRALAGFIVEAIASILPTHGIVLDLMCGSGAVAGACSRFWRTFASDAQQFCMKLALIQGGGYNRERAQVTLSHLLPYAREHAAILRRIFAPAIDLEDQIFHGDLGDSAVVAYRDLMRALTDQPQRLVISGWDSFQEILRRKKAPDMSPYCLFTTYFANVFFGLQQSIEIDSLRFAVDQLPDEEDRDWALGTLTASVSALATSYGGHFAQPIIRRPDDIVAHKIAKIVEKRSRSVFHEFSVRFLQLADQSEKTARAIAPVLGPWEVALRSLDEITGGVPVAVYVDAPYTRDEYSRYYHVLETLIKYSYPLSTGSGRIPSKGAGERFASEFMTRSESLLTALLVRLLTEIVRRGWIAVWSYSTIGRVSIPDVVAGVAAVASCEVRSYAAPYVYKPQGRRGAKRVNESLLLLIPH